MDRVRGDAGRALWPSPAGAWWRFDRYEVGAGVIRPAPGARLEQYDPWADHGAVRVKRARGDEPAAPSPYASLLALVDQLAPAGRAEAPGLDAAEVELTEEGAAALAAWCGSHGLLGLLPHQAYQVTLAPRWEAPDVPLFGHLQPTRRWYVRDHIGWGERVEAFWQTKTPAFDAGAVSAREGGLVDEALLPDYWPEPHVLLQGLREPGWWVEPLDGPTWASFFPAVPDAELAAHAYPKPCSEAFWGQYAEPVADFLGGAAVLRDALAKLGPGLAAGETAEVYLGRVWTGSDTLHALLAAVTPSLLPRGDGSYAQEWRARSLLGVYAMMAYLDLTERRRVFACAACGAIFTSGAYQARYCSERCRYREQKRAYRGRVRAQAGAAEKAAAGRGRTA